MITIKQSRTLVTVALLSLSLSACSAFDWLVFKPDVPQGNYLEAMQIEKLRIDMTKEQVEYILGRPVLQDSFANDTWYYVYHFKSGRNADVEQKQLILNFRNNQLVNADSDYELSANFNTPLGQEVAPAESSHAPLELPTPIEPRPLVKQNDPAAQVLKQFNEAPADIANPLSEAAQTGEVPQPQGEEGKVGDADQGAQEGDDGQKGQEGQEVQEGDEGQQGQE